MAEPAIAATDTAALIELRLDQATLAAIVAAGLKQAAPSAQDVKAHVDPQTRWIHVAFAIAHPIGILGRTVTATLDFRLAVQVAVALRGRGVQVTVEHAETQLRSLPGFLKTVAAKVQSLALAAVLGSASLWQWLVAKLSRGGASRAMQFSSSGVVIDLHALETAPPWLRHMRLVELETSGITCPLRAVFSFDTTALGKQNPSNQEPGHGPIDSR